MPKSIFLVIHLSNLTSRDLTKLLIFYQGTYFAKTEINFLHALEVEGPEVELYFPNGLEWLYVVHFELGYLLRVIFLCVYPKGHFPEWHLSWIYTYPYQGKKDFNRHKIWNRQQAKQLGM